VGTHPSFPLLLGNWETVQVGCDLKKETYANKREVYIEENNILEPNMIQNNLV